MKNWVMKYCLLTLVPFFLNVAMVQTAAATNTKKTESTKLETKALMQEFLHKLTVLKEFFVSESKFTDVKNNVAIAAHLKEFVSLAKQTKHDATLIQENFKFSRYVLEEHIVDTERVFRLGNKSYARRKLASTISVCMSCHTQMPTADRSFSEFNNTKIFTSELDRAEFLFATRSFDKASALYDKIISNYPKNKFSIDQIESALERQLVYFSRIKKSPQDALVSMKRYLNNKEFPTYLVKNLNAWNLQFEKWSKEKVLNTAKATDHEILDFAKKNIEEKWTSERMEVSNPNLVTYLHVSGVLFEYLQQHPESKATAEVLYWLSICDRSINNNLFYSLSDLYLRECMVKYPEHPVAKKCYQEYEAETILGYTGSAGTDLPTEVETDLAYLKKLVDSKGKINSQQH